MKSDARYIEVAVALPISNTFTYGVPKSLANFAIAGKRVLIPFGRRRVTGYVFGQSRFSDEIEIKTILDILDEEPLFPATMVPFFRWIADYYKYPIGEVVKNALPAGLNIRDYTLITLTERGRTAVSQGRLTPMAKEVLGQLLVGPSRLKEICKKANQNIPTALLNTLERNGWITKKWVLSGVKTKAKLERFVHPVGTGLATEGLSKPRKKIIDVLRAEGEISLKKKGICPSVTKEYSGIRLDQPSSPIPHPY